MIVRVDAPWPTGPEWEPVGDEPVLIEVGLDRRRGRGRYWRPNGSGYTDDPTRAGHYAASCGPCAAVVLHDPGARLIPLRMVRPALGAALVESLARLAGGAS